jgi:hypothetical protein
MTVLSFDQSCEVGQYYVTSNSASLTVSRLGVLVSLRKSAMLYVKISFLEIRQLS